MTMKKITYMMLVLFMSLTIFGGQQASAGNITFQDISPKDEIYDKVNYLVNLGIIHGVVENGQTYYKPNSNVTRAEAAKMLVIATGNKPLTVSKSSFKDVDVNNYFSGYIERATQLGFFSGYGNGNFGPNDPLTRGQASKILALAFHLDVNEHANLSSPFSDISKSDGFFKYINAIYYSGIAQGSNGKFYSKENVTRGQFALFVARSLSSNYRLDLPVQGITNEEIGKVKVTADTLNVRSTPTTATSSNKIGKVYNGTILSVYEDSGNGWLKVSYNGNYAYVSKQYTTSIEEKTGDKTEVPDLSKAITQVKVTVDDLNVRSTPNSSNSSNIIGEVNTGDLLYVFEDSGSGWIKVSYNNQYAYVWKQYTTDLSNNNNNNQDSSADASVKGRVVSDNLNIRSGPGTSHEVIATIPKGTEVTILDISGYWAKVQYGSTTGYAHKSYMKLINQQDNILKNRIIVIDPGHGGKDPGTSYESIYEKNIVMKVASIVQEKLEADGAKVIMTRTGDTYPTLQDRVDITLDNYGELFVSIHVNSASSSSAKGTETYYSVSSGDVYQEDITLATAINNEIVENANMKDRGVKKTPYYVINNTVIPSVLVELGFITNSEDRAKLVNSKYVTIYADSIYNGIVQYYRK